MDETHSHQIGAYGILEFCRAHSISRAFFYKLQKQGKAPRTFKAGNRTFVSTEAASEWRQRMELKKSSVEQRGASSNARKDDDNGLLANDAQTLREARAPNQLELPLEEGDV